MGAFNTGFDTANLHRPTTEASDAAAQMPHAARKHWGPKHSPVSFSAFV
jgi:hypothetical protein